MWRPIAARIVGQQCSGSLLGMGRVVGDASIGLMAAPPPLDIAAVIAYCEQRVPPHALHQVRIEAAIYVMP